ncbi:MAG: phosphoglycerate kinase [Candidatus Paceibacterota bacterium]|jgi:3-phosphoglycerate kinase
MTTFLNDSIAKKYAGKTALLRIDLNIVPGKDSFRLEAVIPTIKLLLKHKVRVVLLSHRGRPGANKGGDKKEFSLLAFAPIIAEHLKVPFDFIVANRVGGYKKAVAESDARVILLENLRYFKGEEINDPTFAREFASLGDCYVNDAFAVSHRENASVSAITKYLPSFGGLQLEKELKYLGGVMKSPTHPLVVIIGGAKTADKLPLIERFWEDADAFLTGGGPGNTLLAAQGIPMHDSLYDKKLIFEMKPYAFSEKVYTLVDAKIHKVQVLDIGPETAKEYTEVIKDARTIIWNGPVGLFEKEKFSYGTKVIWNAILENKKATVVVGGGETVASLKLVMSSFKVPKNVFLSTGGGAMLEYLSGKKLPGVEALKS